ncbi:MAG: hypothetical protein R3288_06720 [Woeseiaceae bacterium]|nr:hypothetical protein [Woeseiaceae bacterium]
MLKSVACITYVVADYDASAAALSEFLRHRLVREAVIGDALADFWHAPATAGRRYGLFQPQSGEPCLIRLIDDPDAGDVKPFTTCGWNATEIHVRDVHGLAKSLQGSPYRILGGPRDLLGNGTAIALQIAGPSNEALYLTEINSAAMQKTYGRAESAVGRTFIVVLGASEHAASMAYYGDLTGRRTRPRRFAIRVLADAHGLDYESDRFLIGSAPLQDAYRIEIDGYPASAGQRIVKEGHLPPGMAIVTMKGASATALPQLSTSNLHGVTEAPYFEKPTCLLEGPDREIVEIVDAEE